MYSSAPRVEDCSAYKVGGETNSDLYIRADLSDRENSNGLKTCKIF